MSRDTKRIKEMDRKSSDHTKKSRKRHRAVRKGFRDKEMVEEGLTIDRKCVKFLMTHKCLFFFTNFIL